MELIGLPGGLYPLSQATIALARAPRSNLIKRAYRVAAVVAATSREPVPLHLRSAVTSLMARAGYHFVHNDLRTRDEMTCLPELLRGHCYVEEGSQRDPERAGS